MPTQGEADGIEPLVPAPGSAHLRGCFQGLGSAGVLHLHGSHLSVHPAWALGSEEESGNLAQNPGRLNMNEIQKSLQFLHPSVMAAVKKKNKKKFFSFFQCLF